MPDLDELDYGILHLLQTDARNQTPVDMAEQLPVSAQTVRNRISNLEDEGVIEGYIPVINYEKAGFPLHVEFACTAPVDERETLARQALDIPHMVRVQELLSAKKNLRPQAVTCEAEEFTEVARQLVNLGLTIESERLVRDEYRRPMNHFGESVLDGL